MLLLLATLFGLILLNSPFANIYKSIINFNLAFEVGPQAFSIPLHVVVNDFMMSIFFLSVGIEIKKEMIEGHLATRSQRALPILCAISGVIAPCIIYLAINYCSSDNRVGWAIPTATDIAFAVAVMSMFTSRIPHSIRIFVTALAIIDDLIAVIAIAVFYTSNLDLLYLSAVAACIGILCLMNSMRVAVLKPYMFIGSIMFLLFYFSGVHSTISGVALGFCMPLAAGRKMLTSTQKFVTYIVMPLFAFFNSGVSLKGLALDNLFEPVTLGVFLGLFLGKQLGIFGCFYTAIKSKIISMPAKADFIDAYIASILCGIGFTMSLFVSSLAFDQDTNELLSAKIGILLGSLASCLYGAFMLKFRKVIK